VKESDHGPDHRPVRLTIRTGALRGMESRTASFFRKTPGRWGRSHFLDPQRPRKRPRTCFEAPFGEVTRATGPMAKANPFGFSTKYQDDETDLLYYGYRYYNASTGRWLSKDPMEETGGLNLYEFALNSPVELVDKNGLTTYDFDKNTYYRSINFQPGDIVIFPGGAKVMVQSGDQSAIAKYKCLLSKLGFDYSSPSFPVNWAIFNNGGTAWTLDYGIPSKRPTFFDKQRMDPPTTVNAELNLVTVWVSRLDQVLMPPIGTQRCSGMMIN
jgi:RHS repeat-associated protein